MNLDDISLYFMDKNLKLVKFKKFAQHWLYKLLMCLFSSMTTW